MSDTLGSRPAATPTTHGAAPALEGDLALCCQEHSQNLSVGKINGARSHGFDALYLAAQ